MIKFKSHPYPYLFSVNEKYTRKNSEYCDFAPIYAITAENITKSSKSNSTKNPTCENFGHLNQSRKTRSTILEGTTFAVEESEFNGSTKDIEKLTYLHNLFYV